MKKDNVDWSQSKVIFISTSFTTYQRKAIEFKDLPIELWEVKQYSNNTILFNQIQSQEKSESITKISQKSELVRSVSNQVKQYTEEYHIENGNERIKTLYKEVKELILSISPEVVIKPKAKYVAFLHNKNFVDIVVRKSNLTLFLNMNKGTLNDPQKGTRDVSRLGHWGNGEYELIINDASQLGYASSLIRQSYEKN